MHHSTRIVYWGIVLCLVAQNIDATRISFDMYRHSFLRMDSEENKEERIRHRKIVIQFDEDDARGFAWYPINLKKLRKSYPSGVSSFEISGPYPQGLAYFGHKNSHFTMKAFFMPSEGFSRAIHALDEVREDISLALEQACQNILFPYKNRNMIAYAFIPQKLLDALEIDYEPWVVKKMNLKFSEIKNHTLPLFNIYKLCFDLSRMYPARFCFREMIGMDSHAVWSQLLDTASFTKDLIVQDFFGPDRHKANIAAFIFDRGDCWRNIPIDLKKHELCEERMTAYYHHAGLNSTPWMIVSTPEHNPLGSAWYIRGEQYRAEIERRYKQEQEMREDYPEIYHDMRGSFFYVQANQGTPYDHWGHSDDG